MGYSVWLGAWCVLGTVVGLKLLAVVIKKWGRTSIIIFLLAVTLFIGAIAALV